MASGSNITASGMQTMTQVVAGTDLIDDVDFNNMRTNVARLFGGPQDMRSSHYQLSLFWLHVL